MGKNLIQRLVLGATLALGLAGCGGLPLINFLPKVEAYEAYQRGRDAKVTVNVVGDDCNGKEDIAFSRAGVDKNGNGFLEEYPVTDERNEVLVKRESSAISLGVMNTGYGTFNTIAEVEDLSGEVARAYQTVEVVPPEMTFVGNLSASTILGNIPFEDYFSYTGDVENSDATISRFKIGMDLNGDGNLGAGEIIKESTVPISYEKVTFTETGIYPIYGQCILSDGTPTELSEPLNITANSQIVNPDLSGDLQFLGSPYNLRGKITYAGRVDNITSPYQPVTLDNLGGKSSLEFKVLLEIIPGIAREVLYQRIQNEIELILKQNGYLKLEQTASDAGDSLIFKVANSHIKYDIFNIDVGNNEFTYEVDSSCYTLSTAGTYLTQMDIKYTLGDETQERIFTFLSPEFEVLGL